MNKFRLNTKTVFLTYPQCSAKKEELRDFLVANYDVEKYVIAHEEHKDGGDHLHALVRFTKKVH